MRLKEIKTKDQTLPWAELDDDFDLAKIWEHRDSPECVCKHHKPWLEMPARDIFPQELQEMTYKDIAQAIDPNFLSHKIRADELKFVQFRGFDGDTMIFRVTSSDYGKTGEANENTMYNCLVKFDEWEEIGQDQSINYLERARMLLWVGNVRLHCSDPSFLYWGFQWILTQMDAAIEPETMEPVRNNPGHRGIVCKHLNRVLRVLPFYAPDIAKEMRRQFGA